MSWLVTGSELAVRREGRTERRDDCMFCPREDVRRFGLVSSSSSSAGPCRDDLGRVSPPVEADGRLNTRGVSGWFRRGRRVAGMGGGGGGKAIGSSDAESSSRDSLKHRCVFGS